MAQQWYDPNTWKTYDDNNVSSYNQQMFDSSGNMTGFDTINYAGPAVNQTDSGYGLMAPDLSGVTRLKQGDVWSDYLSQNFGTNFDASRNYLNTLHSQYGIMPSDIDSAYAKYFQGSGSNAGDVNWWGDQARLRALGTGFDSLGKTADWKSAYNPGAETSQQKTMADIGNSNQAGGDVSDLETIMDLVKGAGFVLGGAGLAGAFGGLGAAGGAAATTPSAGALGSGTFGLDVGLGSATGSLGSLGVGATGTGAVAAGGGALGSGLAGLGAADLTAAGLGGLAGATGGLAGVGNAGTTAIGTPVDSGTLTGGGEGGAAADPGGSTFTGTPSSTGGGDVSLWDDVMNALGPDSGNVVGSGPFDGPGLGDAWNGAMNTGGSDWSTGLDTAMNAGQSNTGFWDQAKSLLSQGKNIPTSLIKSVFGTDDATSASIASMIGKLGAAGLGAYASNQQSNALADVAKQYAEYGAPYRAQLASLQTDPGSFLSSPRVTSAVDQGTSAMARALSARDGNPVGSGRALQELQNYSTNSLYGQLTNRENQLANFGGLSSFNSAAPSANLASVQQTGNMYNAIGAGINDIFNPQPTYIDLIKAMKGLP